MKTYHSRADLLDVLTYIRTYYGIEVFESLEIVSMLKDLEPELKTEAKVLERLVKAGYIPELKRISQIEDTMIRQKEAAQLEIDLEETELISPRKSGPCIQALVNVFTDERLDGTRQPKVNSSDSKTNTLNTIGDDHESDSKRVSQGEVQSNQSLVSRIASKRMLLVALVILITIAVGATFVYYGLYAKTDYAKYLGKNIEEVAEEFGMHNPYEFTNKTGSTAIDYTRDSGDIHIILTSCTPDHTIGYIGLGQEINEESNERNSISGIYLGMDKQNVIDLLFSMNATIEESDEEGVLAKVGDLTYAISYRDRGVTDIVLYTDEVTSIAVWTGNRENYEQAR